MIAEIQGYIDCSVKLTGMPDLTMSFVNHRLLDDVSFHPCVRYKRWEVSTVKPALATTCIERPLVCKDHNFGYLETKIALKETRK